MSMSLCFRRLYATHIPKPTVSSPFTARIASAPRKVRLRRLRKEERERSPRGIRVPTPKLPPLSLRTAPLSPTEKERYDRLRDQGALLDERRGFIEPTEEEWLDEVNAKRSRIRGVVKRKVTDAKTGETQFIDDVVGVRVYLPNIEFYMIRNFTPPSEPYNPWEATFRIPLSFTKLDVRGYLWAVYGVKCTYIRTQVLLKTMEGELKRSSRKNQRSHKRAVVGLVEPFYYPDAMEDMNTDDRLAMQKWLDESHGQYASQIQTRKAIFDQLQQPYKREFRLGNNRGQILKKILARRKGREYKINKVAQRYLPPPDSSTSTATEVRQT